MSRLNGAVQTSKVYFLVHELSCCFIVSRLTCSLHLNDMRIEMNKMSRVVFCLYTSAYPETHFNSFEIM